MSDETTFALQFLKDIRARRVEVRRNTELWKSIDRDLASNPPQVREGPRSIEGLAEFSWPLAHWNHGQRLQDFWVAYELGAKRNGYFVEFGAANGTNMSNTVMLERRFGWTGILSEPNLGFHNEIRRSRKCRFTPKAVHDATGTKLEFVCASRPMLSRLAVSEDARNEDFIAEEIVQVETITLNDLLDEFAAPSIIDYISIDTEGTEYQILSAFDFGARHVRALSIEHNYGDRREQIHALMTANGYVRRFEYLSGFDDWYLHRDDVAD
ncbi:FkbM family methyltransferase [Aliiruegeria lutimaris]|uniref:Methyltransferase, FkbM family n=1 Tax=Aliiruegeria lutimaris TaxID=571298 RepID=A0A1G9Q9J6_9RHOB|nr:FkbM family methyltransferase [Aliiruegeria lutimaris]SDM07613.1 methyltransferase, FkbM family [Aliiruegeria lutimaris]